MFYLTTSSEVPILYCIDGFHDSHVCGQNNRTGFLRELKSFVIQKRSFQLTHHKHGCREISLQYDHVKLFFSSQINKIQSLLVYLCTFYIKQNGFIVFYFDSSFLFTFLSFFTFSFSFSFLTSFIFYFSFFQKKRKINIFSFICFPLYFALFLISFLSFFLSISLLFFLCSLFFFLNENTFHNHYSFITDFIFLLFHFSSLSFTSKKM